MSSKLKNTLIQGELFVSPTGSTTDSGIKIRYAGGRGYIESSSGTTRGSITLGSYNNSYGVECFLNFSTTKTLALVPASTISHDIGSEDYRYRNIYSKNINVSGDTTVYGPIKLANLNETNSRLSTSQIFFMGTGSTPIITVTAMQSKRALYLNPNTSTTNKAVKLGVNGECSYISGAFTVGSAVTADAGYTFQVNGKSKLSGDTYVYGDLHATAAYEISDIRLKENIKPLEDRGNLSPVSFKFKDKEGQHLGFIAQELQEKYPEIVTENNDGYLSVNYPEITAILAAQVNDLKKEIADLKQEIQNLKK